MTTIQPTGDPKANITLADISLCFEGAVPAVIATSSAGGTPNVTYLSRVHMIGDERVALSNQFFSKTARNLAENPRASVLLMDPTNYDQFRLAVVYERTARRGAVFERLRYEVDALAALHGMEDIFKLRSADIYRVVDIEQIPTAATRREAIDGSRDFVAPRVPPGAARLAELCTRLSRCQDLDTLVGATVDGLAELCGYDVAQLSLLDEGGTSLYTIASHGYPSEGVGSEVQVGETTIGVAAERCTTIRLGNARQMNKYSSTIRRSFEEQGDFEPAREIPPPAIADVESRLAVPALALGQLVGVLMVESTERVAFTAEDEALLEAIASLVANAVENTRGQDRSDATDSGRTTSAHSAHAHPTDATHVRFFAVDGSTFIDGDYLIKGVAGRILWTLLNQYENEGRVDFTNREVRLDPSLELPEFRDNFESRLILLKRRLDERNAPILIEKTGRGRFRLVADTVLRLESVGDGDS